MEKEFIYQRIADLLEKQILTGILKAGDKLPSLRMLCQEYGVSQNTAIRVYQNLESKMLIESKPQSGYFVRYTIKRIPSIPKESKPKRFPQSWSNEDIVETVYKSLDQNNSLLLSLGRPSSSLLPIQKLNKGVINAVKNLKGHGIEYEPVEGNIRLRRQIARWAFTMEKHLTEDDIITTHGCLNAIAYCLMAVTQRGDTVAMESPVSFGMLQIAHSLGLKVIELPTHPLWGVDLDILEKNFQRNKINVCLFITNFSNPLGTCMPDENKKRLVKLLYRYNVPLIENDINGDVYFGAKRPKSCKTFDKNGMVMWCGSVSKTLASGYRVGWVAPGKYYEHVKKIKLYHSISSSPLTQEVIAGFLETGRYEYHLKKLRHVLQTNCYKMTNTIAKYFPEGTFITRPQGGFILWIELPNGKDTLQLFETCLKYDISFAPGRIFTMQNQYNNCLRLNFGMEWTKNLEDDIKHLGKLANQLKC